VAKPSEPAAAVAVKPYVSPPQAPEMAVTTVNIEWERGGLGDSIAMANITIRNKNEYAVKDIGLVCSFSGKSGTEFARRSKVIYDIIPAKKQRTFRDLTIGFWHEQTASAWCSVESAARL
jgi:hypothetical protein